MHGLYESDKTYIPSEASKMEDFISSCSVEYVSIKARSLFMLFSRYFCTSYFLARISSDGLLLK